MSVADVRCTGGGADENCTPLQAGSSVADPGAADVREGATGAVTSLPEARLVQHSPPGPIPPASGALRLPLSVSH